MSIDQRKLFETAVVERLAESGFLEIEVRVEALARGGDDYQDELINAAWHYWNAALAAQPQPPTTYSHVGGAEEAIALLKKERDEWKREAEDLSIEVSRLERDIQNADADEEAAAHLSSPQPNSGGLLPAEDGEFNENEQPEPVLRIDVDRLASAIVTAACELDGPADQDGEDTISITAKDLDAVVHRHVTAALEALQC